MNNNVNIGALIAAAALFGGAAYLLLKQRRNSGDPSLLNNNTQFDMKETYPSWDLREYSYAELSRGYRNNNPVNIDYDGNNDGKADNPWVGQVGIEPPPPNGGRQRFAQFISIPYGYRAALALLRGKGYISGGYNTIKKIISKFAPSNENYTTGYINYVSNMTGIDPNRVINKNDKDALTSIVYAMAKFENGESQIASVLNLPNMELINEGWRLL